jgi:hypothetical protein
VKAKGAVIIGVFDRVGSGFDPAWLIRPAALARQHGARLVAESTSRFIRNRLYHSRKNWKAQATEPELEDLARWTRGVVLVTALDPDASPEQERDYESNRRGGKDRGGETPLNRDQFRERDWLPLALNLAAAGMHLRPIALKIEEKFGDAPTPQAIGKWLKRLRRGGP